MNDFVTNEQNSKLYTFIKGKRCDNSRVTQLKKDGIAHSDPKTKVTILNDKFSSVLRRDHHRLIGSQYPDMHSFTVNQVSVQKLTQNLKPHKAEGPDRIPTRFLKMFAVELSSAMTLMFQA